MNFFEKFIYKNSLNLSFEFLKKENIQLTGIKQVFGLYIIFYKIKQKIYLGQSGNFCRCLGDPWHT